MKTNITEQKQFYILGVPRTGTTIIANLFNSLDDGMCMIEPHWWAFNRKMHYDFFDDIRAGIGPNLCGYKETYRLGHTLSDELIRRHTPLVDIIVIVFRDPVMAHSSQRALGWREWDKPECYNKSYSILHHLSENNKDRAVVVVLEDFVIAPLKYINDRLSKLYRPFRIHGKLNLKPGHHKYGDPFANRSTEIISSQREICLAPYEIKSHAQAREIWQMYRE